MITKTVTFDLNDTPLQHWKTAYEDFLTYEHTTGNKALWLEQKKIYEEIFNAPDPKAALAEFSKLDMTTSELAQKRMGQ